MHKSNLARLMRLAITLLLPAAILTITAPQALASGAHPIATTLSRGVNTQGETFFDQTFEVTPTGPVVIAGSNDGQASFYVDDKYVIDITGSNGFVDTLQHDEGCGGIQQLAPLDLRAHLSSGVNKVRVRFMDTCGIGEGNSDVFFFGDGSFSGGAASVPTAAQSCVGHGAKGWTFKANVSDNDGLVLDQARFGPRLLATRMSVPYVEISGAWTPGGRTQTRRIELVSDPSKVHPGGLMTATPVGPQSCTSSGTNSISDSVTYSVNDLPSGVKIWIRQSYRFDSTTVKCEPSALLPCGRFWPTVEWGAIDPGFGTPLHFLDTVRIVQRLEFNEDPLTFDSAGSGINRGNIYQDQDVRGGIRSGATTVSTLGSGGSMRTEDRVLAIYNGDRHQTGKNKTWDSWHQTDRNGTSNPGSNPFDSTPGCSECVHAHWAWAKSTNITCDKNPVTTEGSGCFTDGKPEILDGSIQTTHIAVVKYSPDADQVDPAAKGSPVYPEAQGDDQSGYRALINKEGLRDGRPVIFWDSVSPGYAAMRIDGTQFRFGDATWPQLSDTKHGGNGAMFFAPARKLVPEGDPKFAATPQPARELSTALDRRVPAGWVVPVAVTYNGCASRKESSKGPFWLSVHTTGDQKLLNPESTHTDVPEGDPFVLLRSDQLSTQGAPRFVPGSPVAQLDCSTAATGPPPVNPANPGARGVAKFAYLVFAQDPRTQPNFKLTLVGAPNGVNEPLAPFEES